MRRCMAYDALVQALMANDGTCDVGLGGVTVSTEKEAAGISVRGLAYVYGWLKSVWL